MSLGTVKEIPTKKKLLHTLSAAIKKSKFKLIASGDSHSSSTQSTVVLNRENLVSSRRFSSISIHP